MEEEDKGKLRALDKISAIRGGEMRCRDYHRTRQRERGLFSYGFSVDFWPMASTKMFNFGVFEGKQ